MITTAMLTMTYCWARRETTPSGFCVWSETCGTSVVRSGMGADTVAINDSLLLPFKCHVLLADLQIPFVHNFGQDVSAVFQLKVDDVRLVIFDLIDGEFLGGVGLDVSELIVVVDGGDAEGLGLFVAVIEADLLGRVLGFELVHRILGLETYDLHLS